MCRALLHDGHGCQVSSGKESYLRRALLHTKLACLDFGKPTRRCERIVATALDGRQLYMQALLPNQSCNIHLTRDTIYLVRATSANTAGRDGE